MRNVLFALVGLFCVLCVSAQEEITFPDDLSAALVGKEVIIKNPMYVVQTYYRVPEGPVELSSKVLRVPTDVAFPGSTEYRDVYEGNEQDRLRLEGTFIYLNEDGTLRIGQHTGRLRGILGYASGRYSITPTLRPVFTGNQRSAFHGEIGECNMKVVSLNLEYYMASPQNWGYSNGAENESQFRKQRSKILTALHMLDADVYALCEVEEGDVSVKDLTEGLNRLSGTDKYHYVEDNDRRVTSYTKNVFIYNSETVIPYRELRRYSSTYLPKRHIAQAFDLRSNGERVIISLNHFKSKSGTGSGANADQGDGQGNYNATRIKEARDCLAFFNSLTSYYDDSDILVVGDLNAYSREDPIMVFEDAGYASQLERYSPDNYSYSYKREVGYLDHSLSSTSLEGQVTGAVVWNINADEPDFMGYKYPESNGDTPYRCSDHNPVVTGLRLGGASRVQSTENSKHLFITQSAGGDVLVKVEDMVRLEVFHLSGRLVYGNRFDVPVNECPIPVEVLGNGLYIVKVYSGDGFLTGKITVGTYR